MIHLRRDRDPPHFQTPGLPEGRTLPGLERTSGRPGVGGRGFAGGSRSCRGWVRDPPPLKIGLLLLVRRESGTATPGGPRRGLDVPDACRHRPRLAAEGRTAAAADSVAWVCMPSLRATPGAKKAGPRQPTEEEEVAGRPRGLPRVPPRGLMEPLGFAGSPNSKEEGGFADRRAEAEGPQHSDDIGQQARGTRLAPHGPRTLSATASAACRSRRSPSPPGPFPSFRSRAAGRRVRRAGRPENLTEGPRVSPKPSEILRAAAARTGGRAAGAGREREVGGLQRRLLTRSCSGLRDKR